MAILKLEPKILMHWNITGKSLIKKDKRWFFWFLILETLFIIYALITKNYLFLIILILIAIIFYIQEKYPPKTISFEIRKDGIKLGDKKYSYKDIKSFSILYKPEENVRKLFIEFKNKFVPGIEIPIDNQNPLKIRNFLLKYIPEIKLKQEPIDHLIQRTFKL